MSPIRSWKRSISLAALVAVACGALQAATPMLERATAVLPLAQREARLLAPKPRAALGQVPAGLSGQRTASARSAADMPREVREEPRLEPWSLLAGALAVMLFVAGRRRID